MIERLTLVLAFLFLVSPMVFAEDCNGMHVFGRIEEVMLTDKKMVMDAKLDTGAVMASLSATNIKIIKRDDKSWVQFSVQLSDNAEKVVFTEPLVRVIKILNRAGEKDSSEIYSTRPVISMAVCVGDQERVVEVNLADRSRFRYDLLLGMQTIKQFNALIDVSKRHLMKAPHCS